MDRVKRIHKSNYILSNFISCVFLLLAIVALGLKPIVIVPLIIMIVAIAVSSVFYFGKFSDDIKAIGIIEPIQIASILYSLVLHSTSSSFFIVCIYAFVAARYFRRDLLVKSSTIPTVLLFVLAFIKPQVIQGIGDTDMMNAVIKVILYICIVILACFGNFLY